MPCGSARLHCRAMYRFFGRYSATSDVGVPHVSENAFREAQIRLFAFVQTLDFPINVHFRHAVNLMKSHSLASGQNP